LAKFKGQSLSLNGVTSLPGGTAKALASFKGGALNLRGLTCSNNETMQALATLGKKVVLSG
jgi:hypothetical protein